MSSTSTVEKKERAGGKAPAVSRESDGCNQLVPYPGWLLIVNRIAKKKGVA